MTKIVVNKCHGGFSVSLPAARRMAELGHATAAAEVAEYDAKVADPAKQDKYERARGEPRWYGYGYTDEPGSGYKRDDPILVQVVEDMGRDAGGELSALEVVEVPDDVEWTIEEYDGLEWVAEKHRTW